MLVIGAAPIPVFLAQVRAQRQMRQLQPDVKALQDKYKGKTDQLSRQALVQEQMALYKKHGTNPFSASLLHGGGDPTAVAVPAVVMVQVVTACQFLTQRLVMARTTGGRDAESPFMRQQKVLLYVLPVVFGAGG